MLAYKRLVTGHLKTHPLCIRTFSCKMSTFSLPDASPPVKVTLSKDLTQEDLLNFPAFKTWISTLKHNLSLQQDKKHAFHASPYVLRNINVQTADWFGPKKDKLGFVKLTAEVTNDDGEYLPGSVFLRGGSVAMLLILQPDDVPANSETDKHVLLTVQPRIPAGSLSFVELPAGMLDDNGSLKGAAIKEIQEETGLEVSADELTNLSELALSSSPPTSASTPNNTVSMYDANLQNATYPTPGGSDEFIPVFLAQKRIPRADLDGFVGKLTGERDHGEKITLQICRLEQLWRVACRDGKALMAWGLYLGLRGEGRI